MSEYRAAGQPKTLSQSKQRETNLRLHMFCKDFNELVKNLSGSYDTEVDERVFQNDMLYSWKTYRLSKESHYQLHSSCTGY